MYLITLHIKISKSLVVLAQWIARSSFDPFNFLKACFESISLRWGSNMVQSCGSLHLILKTNTMRRCVVVHDINFLDPKNVWKIPKKPRRLENVGKQCFLNYLFVHAVNQNIGPAKVMISYIAVLSETVQSSIKFNDWFACTLEVREIY